jgi:hypothetical protein
VRRQSHIATAWFVGLVFVAAHDARAQSPDSTIASVLRPVAHTLSRDEWDALNLGRAVDRWVMGDVRGAAVLLEAVDVSTTSTFARADRAAFLLAVAYLRLDEPGAFARVAGRAGSADGSAYRKWIRYADLAQRARLGDSGGIDALVSAAPGDFPGGVEMAASLLLEAGRAGDALALL